MQTRITKEPNMTVHQLRELLSKLPGDMPVYTAAFGSSVNEEPLVEVYDDFVYIWAESDADMSREH